MSDSLSRWNELSADEAVQEILSCCGSTAWARALSARRPFHDEGSLVAASDDVWNGLPSRDWAEAFSKHPRIGERKAPQTATAQSASWSAQEQKIVAESEDAVLQALAEGNRVYEARFGRVYIVCATGKSAAEILAILQRRLRNDDASELQEAAEEQRKITTIRLKKWLSQ
jgi:2-oxo-4-hydroxy-4-carboxy-5-ureidoimidazoline decarboxylase